MEPVDWSTQLDDPRTRIDRTPLTSPAVDVTRRQQRLRSTAYEERAGVRSTERGVGGTERSVGGATLPQASDVKGVNDIDDAALRLATPGLAHQRSPRSSPTNQKNGEGQAEHRDRRTTAHRQLTTDN